MSYDFVRGFGSDNHAPVHPDIFSALMDVNHGDAHSYGLDPVSEDTKRLIQEQFGSEVQSYFVFNGTAANVLCLKSLLNSYEAVLCSDVAHLNLDECSAPEFMLGCKLISVKSENGKITPEAIEPHLTRGGDQHAAQPKLISITQPTELGTVYSADELSRLREFAKSKNLYLHIDGARLANAAYRLNMNFSELLKISGPDVVSLGGTKNGMLGAEAVLLIHPKAKENFKFIHKQMMQLPSKTRFLAAQFQAYLQKDLWRRIAEHSCQMAQVLASRLEPYSQVQVVYPVQSNAVFARIPKGWTKSLRQAGFFYVWDETEWVVRLMTSFATKEEDINRFIQAVHKESHV